MASFGPGAVVFGGIGNGRPLADTWVFNGTAWAQLAITGPSGRYGARAAPLGNKIVLFGGTSSWTAPPTPPLADTWVFDGATWSQVNVSPAPSARYGHMMTGF